MNRIISPSILSADFGNLQRDIEMLNRSAAEWIHCDIMDGVFVPNISFGFPVLAAVKKAATKFLDVHLMITDPVRYVKRFAEAGADCITVHVEAAEDVQACIDEIHAAGVLAGISIKPKTDVEAVRKYIDKVDLVLVMSVEPGFGGQSFMPESIGKVAAIKAMAEECGANCRIEVDGGVAMGNAAQLYNAGADTLVAGSSVFKAESPEAEIVKLLEAK